MDALLAFHQGQLFRAVQAMETVEEYGVTDDQVVRAALSLKEVCWAITEVPFTPTPASRALKAAAAMHELRFGYNFGAWENDGQAMAWTVLSEIAGDVYVPINRPADAMASHEPRRA